MGKKKRREEDQKSIFLSLILRHKPEEINIKINKNGWANVNELIEGFNKRGIPLTMEELNNIVMTDSKGRYSFNEEHTFIRANQGHSIDIDLGLEPTPAPKYLYHGTAIECVPGILFDGIHKRSRVHVHLSKDIKTAITVGKRHGKPAVMVIDCKHMELDGIPLYISENGVWLANEVPPQYVKEVIYQKEDENMEYHVFSEKHQSEYSLLLLKEKETEEYRWCNLTRGHISKCRFKTREDAEKDLLNQEIDGIICIHKELSNLIIN